MNSPKQNGHRPGDKSKAPAKPPAKRPHRDDKQNRATTKEFDEENMGVAPKE